MTACPAFPDLSKRSSTPRRRLVTGPSRAGSWLLIVAQSPTFRRCLKTPALGRLRRRRARARGCEQHERCPAPEQIGAGKLKRQGYLTVPPEALIAYHVPPNAFTPT